MPGSTLVRLHQTIDQAPLGGSLPINNGAGAAALPLTGAGTATAGWLSTITVVSSKSDAWAQVLATKTISLTGMGIAQDDEVIVVYGTSATSIDRGIAVASGWTALFTPNLVFDDTNDVNFVVARKRMGSTPDTSVTLTASSPSTSAVGSSSVVIVVLRGVDSTSFLDVAVGQAGSVASALPDPVSVTTTTDGTFLLVAATSAVSNVAGVTLTPNSEMTQLETITGFTGQTQNVITTVAYRNNPPTGVNDPQVWSYQVSGVPTNPSTSSWASATIAVKPGASATVRNGSANLTLPLSASGTGTAPAFGSGSGAQNVSLSAQGAAIVQGSGSGSLTMSLSAQGSPSDAINGIGAGNLALSILGTGQALVGGVASLAVGVALSGQGTSSVRGSGSLALSLNVAGTGSALVNGQGAGTLVFTLVSTGTRITTKNGSLSATLGFSVSGQGKAPAAGQGAADLPFTLTGVGFGAAGPSSGILDYTTILNVSGAGRALVKGQGNLLFDLTLASDGQLIVQGQGVPESLIQDFTLIGTGQCVVLGEGSGSLELTLRGRGKIVETVVVAKITRNGVWQTRLANGIFSDAERPGSWASKERTTAWI